jgi:germacradienol/geosmin synthase
MPFQSAGRNPHMDSVRGPTKAWAIQVGMVGSGLPGWDEPGYEAANIPRLTALLHPTAARPEFDLVALWSTWAMFLGDFFDEFQAHRDLGGTKVALARLLAFMPVSPTEAFPVPTNPLERGLADLWPRTASRTMPDWRRWFAASVKSIVESFQWEILNLIQNRIPDPVDYIEMRRHTLYPGPADAARSILFSTNACPDRHIPRVAGIAQRRLLLPEGDRTGG